MSQDVDSYPKPCVYCQLDEECNDDDDDEGDEDEDDEVKDELYLVPQDESELMSIFDALSRAAMLNPDQDDEEDSDDGFIYNEEEVQRGAEQARVLEQLESVFHVPAGFAQPGDEEDDEEENGEGGEGGGEGDEGEVEER